MVLKKMMAKKDPFCKRIFEDVILQSKCNKYNDLANFGAPDFLSLGFSFLLSSVIIITNTQTGAAE